MDEEKKEKSILEISQEMMHDLDESMSTVRSNITEWDAEILNLKQKIADAQLSFKQLKRQIDQLKYEINQHEETIEMYERWIVEEQQAHCEYFISRMALSMFITSYRETGMTD